MMWKVLWDYHKKIENYLNRYSRGEKGLLNHVLGEIEVYGAIEDEVVLPAVEQVDPGWVEMAQEAGDRLKELAADIQDLEPGDPMEPKLVKRLAKLWELHTEREEKRLFPLIKFGGPLEAENYEMAIRAFTVRQELIAARGGTKPPSELGMYGAASRGW